MSSLCLRLQRPGRKRSLCAERRAEQVARCIAGDHRVRKAGADRPDGTGGGGWRDHSGPLSAFIASVYHARADVEATCRRRCWRWLDSCIGGKSSINVGPYKSLVGTFHPQAKMLIERLLAETLPPDDQRASSHRLGLGEDMFLLPGRVHVRSACVPTGLQVGMDTGVALEQGFDRWPECKEKKWFIEIE